MVAVEQLGRRVMPADKNRSKVIVKSMPKQLASIARMALAATTKLQQSSHTCTYAFIPYPLLG